MVASQYIIFFLDVNGHAVTDLSVELLMYNIWICQILNNLELEKEHFENKYLKSWSLHCPFRCHSMQLILCAQLQYFIPRR